MSQATLYRLITTYKVTGTVEAPSMPRTRAGLQRLRLLDKKVEALISKCIREIYLTPNRPTLKRLTDEVHARCAAAGFSLPGSPDHSRPRCWRSRNKTRALRRADTAGVKGTTPKRRAEFVATRPLEIVQIDHTEVDVVVVDEKKRQPLPGRPLADPGDRRVKSNGHRISYSRCPSPSRLSMGLCMLRATFDQRQSGSRDHDVSERNGRQ